MRRSYKKLLVFQIIIFAIFFINSFVSNILGTYKTIVFLLITLGIFKVFFGFEKDRHRYIKEVMFEIAIFMMIFFILFYLLGIYIGFARIENYLTAYGMKTFIIPLVLTILVKEYLRYQMVSKSDGSFILTCTTCMLFILIDVSDPIYYANFKTSYGAFIFLAMTLFPAISSNIVCTYITKKVGYKPIILYLLIMNLYQYIIPIIPNPDKYITSVIKLVVPVLMVFRITKFFKADEDEDLNRNYNKKRYWIIIFPTIFIIIIVYFTSGYFHYHAIAIASGSMEPKIYKGDVVVIEKIDDKYGDLKVGQVVAYKYEGVMIVHRLTKIEKVGDNYYFYTKGDNNANEDNYVVRQEMIYGTVDVKIPYIGIPTVWLNEV